MQQLLPHLQLQDRALHPPTDASLTSIRRIDGAVHVCLSSVAHNMRLRRKLTNQTIRKNLEHDLADVSVLRRPVCESSFSRSDRPYTLFPDKLQLKLRF